jgi:hypothetical protein
VEEEEEVLCLEADLFLFSTATLALPVVEECLAKAFAKELAREAAVRGGSSFLDLLTKSGRAGPNKEEDERGRARTLERKS